MLGDARWLSLSVKYLDRARSFYESALDLSTVRESETEVAFDAGEAELRLRAPGPVPRGGLHTHYALSVPGEEYDDWYDELSASFDLEERHFGDARSLYFDDPDDHCVELGETDASEPDVSGDEGFDSGVLGIFEVVLEVEALEPARVFYERLGFEPLDRGGDRRRVRMTTGDVDLELWEPQLGIADGRGGVHVDWGVVAAEPATVADRVARDAERVDEVDAGVRIRDPDGHYLTLVDES